MITKSKVRGMVIGGAIGDAWGMPTEVMPIEKIERLWPNGVYCYMDPKEHKWFNAETMPAGSITDDTILTMATMDGLMARKGFDMEAIAQAHVVAYNEHGDKGFGKSTREAIKRIAEGTPWSEAALTGPRMGTGNGICMKCSPLAAWYASKSGESCDHFNRKMIDFASMTHKTQMGAMSGIIHAHSMHYLLWETPDTFDVDDWANHVCREVFAWQEDEDSDCHYDLSELPAQKDNLETPMLKLWRHRKIMKQWAVEAILKTFGYGSCYVYDSLPFTYAMFYCNPHSMDTVQRIVESGGDADTNAKMCLEMIGALHGYEFFQRDEYAWALNGLLRKDDLLTLADAFCKQFKIK